MRGVASPSTIFPSPPLQLHTGSGVPQPGTATITGILLSLFSRVFFPSYALFLVSASVVIAAAAVACPACILLFIFIFSPCLFFYLLLSVGFAGKGISMSFPRGSLLQTPKQQQQQQQQQKAEAAPGSRASLLPEVGTTVGGGTALTFPEAGGGEYHCACTDAENVVDEQASLQRLAEYISFCAARRDAVSAPPFDETMILECAPSAVAKTAADAAIIRDVFASHPLLCLLDTATREVLVQVTEREEVAPGVVIAPPLEINTSFVIVTHGSVYTTPNEAANRMLATRQLQQNTAPGNSTEEPERQAGTNSSAGDGGANEVGAPHLPGETFFPVNMMYATLPSHIVRAGDDGATIFRLHMQSFKYVLAKLASPPQDAPATPVNNTISVASLPSAQEGAAMDDSASMGEFLQQAQMPPYVFPVEDDAAAVIQDLLQVLQDEMDAVETQELCRRAREKTRRPSVVGESVGRSDVFRPRILEKSGEERAMLRQMIRRLPFFARLPERYVQFIVDAFERRVFPPGALITAADGELSHEFYWVERGHVVSSAVTPTHPSQLFHVNVNGGGNGVLGGTLAWQAGDVISLERLLFMYNDSVDHEPARYAAADQKDEVVLWTVRRVVVKRILMTATLRERQRLLSLIDGVGLFGALSSVEKLHLTDALLPTVYAPGSCLLSEGSTPDAIFFIDTGTIEARRATDRATAAHLQFLGRKSCVGAMEVFTVSRSPFDYVAYSHVTGYRLRCEDVSRMLAHCTLLRIAHGWCVGEGGRQGEGLRSLERLRQEQRDAASDSESEKDYTDDMCPVVLKTADDDAFLHHFFLNSTAFREATSMQRGLAVAAFEPKQELPYGCVLYAEDPTVTCEAQRRQCMYVIADGVVTLSRGGEIIMMYRQGQAVNVTPLLHKRRATPATTATVTSSTCSVYQLDRKSFRCLLMSAYLRHLQKSRSLLFTTPLASRLGDAAITAISNCAVTRVFMPGDIVLACGAEVRWVELVLEGTVDVALWKGAGNEKMLRIIASLGATDIVGALDLLHKRPSSVCYLATSRLRTLGVSAEVFLDSCLRSPAVLEYLRELQRTGRYAFYQRG
ncbi:cAMP-dependent protein kinase type II regulatory chain [Trypanosoma rangeli]|uniref:cAMP-dependent protein kinase type II regulatory chain n=1 Tax=Trypanosoma rangeli TaxID=5698 RepID=A0A3R7KL00_TRYRA|nr:cAMP-dependent protein kinase type II regulatory chain [Trypanosoma rangeli]RNF03532.1 cAMP-dependent protein kinase type II regulatory chain [Trypanosoma rangeli]|eukprot:RNF03532.1 cAMP-dependent protein kinase type II regulatory chain [Trypanosoma rangeli]